MRVIVSVGVQAVSDRMTRKEGGAHIHDKNRAVSSVEYKIILHMRLR